MENARVHEKPRLARAEREQGAQLPILVTKIQPPGRSSGLLDRPRLLALLPLVRSKQLTVIKAAAGFGKTSVALAWAERLRGVDSKIAWLSLDEDDDDTQKAAEFWTMRNEPWPNFHAGKDIREKFPEHGIPYFVLVDSFGKVTLSYAGWDEDILRKAVAALTYSSTFQSPTTH